MNPTEKIRRAPEIPEKKRPLTFSERSHSLPATLQAVHGDEQHNQQRHLIGGYMYDDFHLELSFPTEGSWADDLHQF